MSAKQARYAEFADSAPLRLPDDLETARSKLVYVALAAEGAGTPRGLSRALRLRATEVYPVLRELVERGLVTKQGETYTVEGV